MLDFREELSKSKKTLVEQNFPDVVKGVDLIVRNILRYITKRTDTEILLGKTRFYLGSGGKTIYVKPYIEDRIDDKWICSYVFKNKTSLSIAWKLIEEQFSGFEIQKHKCGDFDVTIA